MPHTLKKIKSYNKEIEVPVFQSTEQVHVLRPSIIGEFLPQLFYALEKESIKRKILPGEKDLRPAYDINLVSEKLGQKPTGPTYNPKHPGEDLPYATSIDIIAGTFEEDSFTGTRNAPLATLHNDGYNWVAYVKAGSNFAVDPDILCIRLAEQAKRYAATAANASSN